jgi:hypothetical protein
MLWKRPEKQVFTKALKAARILTMEIHFSRLSMLLIAMNFEVRN